MDISQRRAFALDSRTVWVEQQLIRDALIPKDNLPLGPGEYNHRPPERHITSPVIGRRRENVDRFRPGLSMQTPLSRSYQKSIRQPSTSRSVSPVNKFDYVENHELKTIHHFSDIRQPFDPKNKHTYTPGPIYDLEDDALHQRSIHGRSDVKTAVAYHQQVNAESIKDITRKMKNSNDDGDGYPCYEVKYDSPQLKPKLKLGTFSKTKRIYVPQSGDTLVGETSPLTSKEYYNKSMEIYNQDFIFPAAHVIRAHSPSSPSKNNNNQTSGSQDAAEDNHDIHDGQKHHGDNVSNCNSPMRSPQRSSASSPNFKQLDPSSMSIAQYRAQLVKLPKLKTKKPPTLIFDDSSYRSQRLQQPIDLTPSLINREAGVHIFDRLYTIPRNHQSAEYKMRTATSLQSSSQVQLSSPTQSYMASTRSSLSKSR